MLHHIKEANACIMCFITMTLSCSMLNSIAIKKLPPIINGPYFLNQTLPPPTHPQTLKFSKNTPPLKPLLPTLFLSTPPPFSLSLSYALNPPPPPFASLSLSLPFASLSFSHSQSPSPPSHSLSKASRYLHLLYLSFSVFVFLFFFSSGFEHCSVLWY